MADNTKDKSGERRVQRVATIRRPAVEVYDACRDPSRIPTFVRGVTSVRETGNPSDRVVGAAGGDVALDVQVTEDVAGRSIAWYATDGAQGPNRAEVSFQPALQGQGTEMRVTVTYEPADGVQSAVTRIAAEDAQKQLDESVMRFKMFMETGHIPTTDGQSHGGPSR